MIDDMDAAAPERDYKADAALWLDKLRAAQKRQDAWEKDAAEAEKAYTADQDMEGGKVYSFNILHSNVETIVPAIYNSTPVPDIRPRFDKNPVAKEFGGAMERVVSVMIDDNKLDKEIEAGARDAYLSGRDVVRLRFEAEVQEVEQETIEVDPATGMQFAGVEMVSQVSGEKITFEAVSWRDFRMGPAKRWEDVQWVAFAHRLPSEEVEEFENPEMVRTQRADIAIEDDGEDVTVWEVWCKKSRTVKWIKEDGSELIREDDDPLGLPGFFPVPEPVQPIALTGKMTPVCPWKIYKKLAEELDLVTRRIARITSGLKVRGIILGSAEDVDKLAQLDDWELAPATGSLEQMAQLRGMDGAVTWWPIDKAIQVLRELYLAREQIKASIYEITGISDIIRGASQASETATAQQIKTQWGSLRIQRMQKLIERQVRDIFVMMVDIIARNFRPERVQELTGLQITPEIQQLMQQPVLAHYMVDVESDSTVRADLSRVKTEMGEFLNGTANFFATMAPVVQQAPQMAQPATELYGAFARVYRLGKQAEDAIDMMGQIAKQASENPPPNPEAEAAQAEMQMKQADMQLRQQEMQMRGQGDIARLQLEREKAQAEVQIKKVELQIKQAELALKERQADFEGAKAIAEMEMEEDQRRAVKLGS